MTRAEQETILRWSPDDEFVNVYTAHLPTHRKLQRGGYVPWRVVTHAGREDGWFYRVPVGELRWRVGARRPARRLTEAEREVRRERLARARLARVS
jgi:hypothetical protein